MLSRVSLTLASLAFAGLLLTVGAAPAQAQTSTKVAVIDVQQILAQSQSGKTAQAEIERLQAAKRTELEGRSQELAALKKRAEEGTLSLAEDKLAELQKEYEDKAIAFKRAQDDANRELQKKGDALMADIEKKILPVISKIGDEEGYTLIFNKYQSGLLYADDAIDITAKVITRLDQAAGGK
ncbi:MAG: OmpH family outer membrane protein [Acidobacteria bacterium]|nr:OmpH family outer membrane protein [Acidobacteriota bacterium]